MKKLILATIMIFLLMGCNEDQVTNDDTPSTGTLTITMNTSAMMLHKTIAPDYDLTIQNCDITGQGPDGESFQETDHPAGTDFQKEVTAGTWQVTVNAKNSDGDIIGSAESTVNIAADQEITASMDIAPLTDPGTLEINIAWPQDYAADPQIVSTLTAADGSKTALSFDIAGDGLSASYSGDIDAGFYIMALQVLDGSTLLWGKTEVVHMVAGKTSAQDYDLLQDSTGVDYSDSPITITLDGAAQSIYAGGEMTVNATTDPAADSYTWYLQGEEIDGETGSSITLGSTLSLGSYTLDLVVEKNNFYSSEGVTFSVLETESSIIFLHHSTGQNIWNGGVPEWITDYNATNGANYQISEQAFPKRNPYGWNNYPYDYWNIWVNHGGPEPYQEEPTLEILTQTYDVIVWKHCFPVSDVLADDGSSEINSAQKKAENYKLQYDALKTKMLEFPDVTFLVWTGAARVEGATTEAEATRARDFFNWVRETWDEPGDNIYLWDFRQLETEGGLYLLSDYAASSTDSHPNATFAEQVAPLFGQRVVDVIEGRGDTGSITGE